MTSTAASPELPPVGSTHENGRDDEESAATAPAAEANTTTSVEPGSHENNNDNNNLENDNDDDGTRPLRVRLLSESRASMRSVAMYGPQVSQRFGRPDHLEQVLVQLQREQAAEDAEDDEEKAAGAVVRIGGGTIMEGTTVGAGSGVVIVTEEEVVSTPTAAVATTTILPPVSPTDTVGSTTAMTPADEAGMQQRRVRAQHHRLYQRVSALAPQDPTNLVQVALKDVSYLVPYQLDKHTKTTVVNQSICYFTYEFFRRLASLFTTSSKDDSDDINNRNDVAVPSTLSTGSNSSLKGKAKPRKYQVRDVASLFVPFEHKPVLHHINLIFKPGKTYVVLGPPGCGKTSLLKAIAGRLPHAQTMHNTVPQPVRGQPHVSGKIEYNGVATQVCDGENGEQGGVERTLPG